MSVADKLNTKLWASSDSDWAGCTKNRRSTSSSYVMLGGHPIASSKSTQNYALTKSASRAVDAVAMAADIAKVVKQRVRGRHGVDGDARSGKIETLPYPSLVGA